MADGKAVATLKGTPRPQEKGEKGAKLPKQLPLWLRRLDLVKAEMKTVRFPKTAAEGFRQCAMLSETMRRWFLDSIRQEHPRWSEEQIEQERRLLLARFSAAETRWIAKRLTSRRFSECISVIGSTRII